MTQALQLILSVVLRITLEPSVIPRFPKVTSIPMILVMQSQTQSQTPYQTYIWRNQRIRISTQNIKLRESIIPNRLATINQEYSLSIL
jgi:hypothetical protein